MTAKRIFQVYQENPGLVWHPNGWRWRLIAKRNGQIVGGSQEAFGSRGNAIRAAKREASLYQPGMATVEVAP